MTMLLTLYAALLVGMVGLIGFGYWLGANTRSRSLSAGNDSKAAPATMSKGEKPPADGESIPRSVKHRTTDTDPRERPDITTQGAAMSPQTYAGSERGQVDE